VQRANAAIAAGADMAFVEAPQTMAEIEQVPKLVKGPCLLNVVRNGKTPEIDQGEAERMGYAHAILPGLLMSGVVGICDQLLAETKKINKHPPTPGDAGPAQIFARFGSAEWDSRRTAFRPDVKRVAAE
jgi:2-methylisocitrate lyase-like PEP mutase family enzyme